jgi:esterase/lipase superfamily enzyme
MTSILFATNRQQSAGAGLPDFGDEPLPQNPGSLTCAVATVDAIDISRSTSGTISAISPLNQGGFTEAQLAPIIASPNDILVFVHGAANSFNDAITRAAYNQAWLAAAALPSGKSDFDVIAFTWPSRPYVIANIVGDYVDYRHDQHSARHSAYHFGLFLQQLYALRARIGNRRLNLLCHSMGNYMLATAVELWFSNSGAPGLPLFDEIILAAADEKATTFSALQGARLSRLWQLGREITTYFLNIDVLMFISHIVNQNFRLGFDGPPNRSDKHFFSPNVYEFVDCAGINDFISSVIESPDRTHQYYRQSPTVRADIAASLAGLTPHRVRYDSRANAYFLFA